LIVSPFAVFQSLWSLYFAGKIGKYAGHPYANFVVAKGVARLDADGVENVVKECKAVAGARGLVSKFALSIDREIKLMAETARTSVLQALVDRSVKLTSTQASVLSVSLPLSPGMQLTISLFNLLLICLTLRRKTSFRASWH